jgi:hypothetical protein
MEVIYYVPVYVEVDVDSRKVTSVTIDAESITHPDNLGMEQPEEEHEAYRIAEDAEWPEWDFGF